MKGEQFRGEYRQNYLGKSSGGSGFRGLGLQIEQRSFMHSFWILGREWGAMQIEQCSFVHSFWILGRGQGMGGNADRAVLFYAFFLDTG